MMEKRQEVCMPVMSTQAELKSVLAESKAPAVSIFVPTYRLGQEVRQNPIQLKNLLKQAEEQLIKEGTRATEARSVLAATRRGISPFPVAECASDLPFTLPPEPICRRVGPVLHQAAPAVAHERRALLPSRVKPKSRAAVGMYA
jgi:hypothetical protein